VAAQNEYKIVDHLVNDLSSARHSDGSAVEIVEIAQGIWAVGHGAVRVELAQVCDPGYRTDPEKGHNRTAVSVGSIDEIISVARLRPRILGAIECGLGR
jgi:hypothetical protein